jgi:hypothetical protein
MIVRLLLAASVAAMLAFTQPQIGGGGGDEMSGMGGGGGRGNGRNGRNGGDMAPNLAPRRQQSKSEQIADKLKLNKDQKDEFEKILSAGREEARPVQETLMKMRAQLASAMVEGVSDADMKKAMDEYTSAAAQMTAIEAKAYGKLYTTLKPNQQGKAAQAFELMAGIFDQRMGGERGMGMGGGQGR